MKLHRNTIYKMIHHSLINNPEEWVIDNDLNRFRYGNITLLSNGYHVENKKIGVKAWIANGSSHFEFESVSNNYFSNSKIKLSVLQTYVLYILYLIKVRKIFIPILILKVIFMMLPLTPIFVWANNHRNKMVVELDISLEDKRDILLNEVLE